MQTTHTTRTAPGVYRVEITQQRDHGPALVMVWEVEIRADSGEVEDSTQTLVSAEWHGEDRDGCDYIEGADWDHPRVSGPEIEVDAYSAALDAYRAEHDIGWCPRCPRREVLTDGSTLLHGPIQLIGGLCPTHATVAVEVAA